MLNSDLGRSSTSSTASSGQRDGGATAAPAGAPEFPTGLRVLLVEDDRVCLAVIAKMLRKCLYHVTTCTRAETALSILRERKGWFDLVLSDVYMPDMDGFKLLECIGLEMDLPVIMMSSEERQDAVMKGVVHGACDYLIKPVRMEPLKNIWQHVVRRRRHERRESEQHSGSIEDSDQKQKRAQDEGDNASSRCEGNWKAAKRRKDEEEDEENEDRDDSSQQKKPRVVWSVDLHGQFVSAVNQLGVEKAVPKKILELMNVPGLTRENVASHLQKFRLYLRRLSNPQHQGRQDSTFTNAQEADVLSAVDRFNFQTISASNQHLTQSLAALQSGQGRNLNTSVDMSAIDQIGFGAQSAFASTARPASVHQMNNRPMNYLPGSSGNINLRQYGPSQSVIQPYLNMPLELGEGTSRFLSFPSSQTSSSSFPGDTVVGELNKSLLMPMTQQRNQLSLAHQGHNMHMNLSRNSQSTGEVINGIGKHGSILPLTSSHQVTSNNLSSHFSGMSGSNARAPTTLVENYGNAYSCNAAPHVLCEDVQNLRTNESSESNYPLMGRIGVAPPTSNSQVFGVTNFKEVNDYASTCNIFNEIDHGQSQGWKWENANLPNQSNHHLDSKQTGSNFEASLVEHKDSIVSIKHGFNSTEMLSTRTEIGHQYNSANVLGNSLRVKPDGNSDIFFDNNATSNELMNMVGRKQEAGRIGQLDNTEFNLDGYTLDDIPV